MLSLLLGFFGVVCFIHAHRQRGEEAEVVGAAARFLGFFFLAMAWVVNYA